MIKGFNLKDKPSSMDAVKGEQNQKRRPTGKSSSENVEIQSWLDQQPARRTFNSTLAYLVNVNVGGTGYKRRLRAHTV